MKKGSKIVTIGGGTGTFTLLQGLKHYKEFALTSIVTMADDGGSNKVLRDEFGLLPTSGIRQSIVALAENKTVLRQLFTYRYYQGVGISGMTFGNLFMAALSDILGSQEKAIEETCKLLNVKGNILPVSYENTSLVATYEDGTEVLGEHYIDVSSPKVAKQRIVKLRLIPAISVASKAKEAIAEADYIILGPGDLYTNTIANLVVGGVRDALEATTAKVIFVMNLMSRRGEAYNYKASDYLTDLSNYLNSDSLDYVLVNSDFELSTKVQKLYLAEGSKLVEDDLAAKWHNAKVVRAKLMAKTTPKLQKGDKTARSIVRHDPKVLAKAISDLIN